MLFTVLVFSGIGSMLSEKVVHLDRPKSIVGMLSALLVVLAIFGSITPWVIRHTDGQTTPIRILIAVGLLAPIALLMGMPLAIGMRVAGRRGAPTSFLWGINGATSVCGSVLAMAVALFFGISVSFWIGWAAYAAAAVAMFVVITADGRRQIRARRRSRPWIRRTRAGAGRHVSDDYCYLTTRGRRTGADHEIEIWYVREREADATRSTCWRARASSPTGCATCRSTRRCGCASTT